MKLKQRPEDFCVEERTEALPEGRGAFALYRLDKTGWTTVDALAAIRRRWQIDWQRLSYGGLKDRHAVTAQYFTIYRGPQRNLSHQRIAVTYLGQRSAPYSAADIRANYFTITLRNLTPEAVAASQRALEEMAGVGLPNYFDDQRFGSVGESRDFIAREMVHGRFEKALWLALAAPYEFDRAEERQIKVILREHWSDWAVCRAKLPKSHARSLVDYLTAHPTDYKGAVARLRPELQGLYLSAYQSYLWNQILAAWLMRNLPSEDRVDMDLKLGHVPAPRRVPRELQERWRSLSFLLPSARVKPTIHDEEWANLAGEVLKGDGITLAELRIKGLQKPFFSKGERAACVMPASLNAQEEADELHKQRRKLMLQFELPRGSYATMLVKRMDSSSQNDEGQP